MSDPAKQHLASPERGGRKRSWKRRLLGPLVSLAVLLILLGVIEGVLRLRARSAAGVDRQARIHDFFYYDEDRCFRIRPNSSGWHRPYEGRRPILVHVNSNGLRGPELREGAHPRIAFVGDSITFDGGVEWEDSFVALVESKLGAPDGVECLNFGTTDAGIVQYELKVRHHVSELEVDALVVCLYLNDSRPPQGFLGETGHEPWESKLAHSAAYSLLTVRELHRQVRAWRIGNDPEMLNRFKWVGRFRAGAYRESEADWLALVQEAQYDWGAAWNEENWAPIESGMAAIAEACRERDITLLGAIFPVSPQVEITRPHANLDLPQQRAGEIMAALDIPYLDLLPALRARRTESLFNDQCHLTAAGNEVVAEALAPWLAEILAVESAGRAEMD